MGRARTVNPHATGPVPDPSPRRGGTLNDRQERFARHYAATLDADEALEEAGYELTTDESRREAKHRLLTNPHVRALVDELLAGAAAKYGLTSDGMVARLKYVYLEAAADRDWGAAV